MRKNGPGPKHFMGVTASVRPPEHVPTVASLGNGTTIPCGPRLVGAQFWTRNAAT